MGIACTSRSPAFAAVTIVVFRDGDAQGEGHGDPFARLHAHGTTLPARSRSVPRKSRSRLPEGLETRSRPRRRFPRRGRRHPESSRERLAAGHRSGRRSSRTPLRYGLCAPRKPATHNSARAAAINKFMVRMRRCISFHRANAWCGSVRASCLRPARVADSDAWRWLALLVLGAAANAAAQPAGPTGPGAAIVRPRQPDRRPLHRQLPRRPGPARRETGERRSSRRRPDRVCRRA